MAENSESDDSDFVPSDKEEEGTSGVGQAQSSELKGLSSAKKRIVDEMWVEMNEQDKREVDEKHAAAVELSYGNPSSKVRRAKQQERLDTLLRSVFSDRSKVTQLIRRKRSRDTEDTQAEMKEGAHPQFHLPKKAKIVEKRKFAGKEIEVTRTVIETQQDTAVIAPSGPQSGLDKMLSVLQGPQTISTVVKSSIDWQNFKEAEGLEDELAVAQKEGYLTRKEFLDRCDVREYEHQRSGRRGPS